MTKLLPLLGVALLLTAGCWSNGPTESTPAHASQAEPPADASQQPRTREIVAGDYRLKLNLAPQVLRLDLQKPDISRPQGTIQADDTVTVVPPTADVRVEDRTVAQVKAGQVLAVSQVQGDFVGVSLLAAGKPVSGWLRRQEVAFKTAESKLVPTLAGIGRSGMLPAALLVQKAKAFDDGLYAAVELATQNGAGRFAGKRSMLSALIADIFKDAPGDAPPVVLLAGAKLGGLAEHLPAAVEPAVGDKIAEFEGDKASSLPIGFYTWSPELKRIFKQDRLLQRPLSAGGADTLAAALGREAASRTTYKAYLELVSRLTNPLAQDDLRTLLKDGAAASPGLEIVCFFPPSRSFEGDLFRRVVGPGPAPDDFNLMNELIKQVHAGKLSLTPTATSGWYDYTAWSLEPLIEPGKAAEAKRLELSKSYRAHLEELFKGTLALARETHTKALPPPAGAKAAKGQRPEFTVSPELSAEPLATSYLRRAEGYRFLAKALEGTFGRQALEKMHRLTQAGPVTANLAHELASMEDLFLGAAVVVSRQLGMQSILPDDLARRAEPAARTFSNWSADPRQDADLSGDLRMMVPVYVDPKGNRIKVWALLGWTRQHCEVSFAQRPEAEVVDAGEKTVDSAAYDIHWTSARDTLATPVVAELYVTQLLDRDAFRQHCDAYWTPAAILANLK
ncbi:MAG TPA: hypothetical protein VIK18_13670 [Pirellulales bacterium]